MMLTQWARHNVAKLYKAWAGPDPHARPSGIVFETLSSTWRSSRSLYRRWARSQPPILLVLDGQPRLTGVGSFTGWVLGRDAEIVQVEAWSGSQLIASTVPDHVRPDVQHAFPHFPMHRRMGFRCCPPLHSLPDGIHPLRVHATDALGQYIDIETRIIVDRFSMQDDPTTGSDIAGTNREYQLWLRAHDTHDLPEISNGPLLSVIMPIYRPRLDHLYEAIASVRHQTYDNWELCLCDDGSGNPSLMEELEELGRTDSRIRLYQLEKNQGISAATNHAFQASQGEYVALLDQDDRLHPQALQAIAVHSQNQPADLYYTDEDRLDARSRRLEPFFKPEWSPDLLHTMMYAGHLCVYRRSLLEKVGYCDSRFDGTQDWDLALRATDDPATRVQHIPGIFYHWRMGGYSAQEFNNRRCHELGREAVKTSLLRQGKSYRVENGPRPCSFHAHPSAEFPKVSILIPTRDQPLLLQRCLNSIRQRTDYPHLEVIVIDNGSQDEEMLSYLSRCPTDRILRIDEPFNHSLLNNRAALEATGDVLLLLNDDTEVLDPHWLTSLVEENQRPNTGAVGAWLIYPDGRTQHAGIILEEEAVARPLSSAIMLDGLDRGLGLLTREVSAVTGACLLIRKSLFLELGGLDQEHLPTSYNDVDLCLRIRQRGLNIMVSPRAKLIHHESASRRVDSQDEIYRQCMRNRWRFQLQNEQCWNPHLGQSRDWQLGLAFHWK